MRELRKNENKTMKEFGAIFNLAESTISGYETGARKPDIDQVRKFADYFGVSMDDITGGVDKDEEEFQAFANDPELGRWYKELPKNDEEDLQKLRQMWDIIKGDKNK